MDAANIEQSRLWNGTAGRAWVEVQQVLDRMFAPFEDLLVQWAQADHARRVLDVGCGTGSTTLALARGLGARAECLGVDISGPMIDLARERARAERSRAGFLQADAQVWPFEAGSVDAVTSRFGVMFFDDPVRAFRNLRRATASGGHLRFVSWRHATENPFMTAAEQAARSLLPDLPMRRTDGPGQFSLSDPPQVEALLQDSGWTQVRLEAIDVACRFPERELARYLSWMGPVGQYLQTADAGTRARVIDGVRRAFDPYVSGAEVCFTAACWAVAARAGEPGPG